MKTKLLLILSLFTFALSYSHTIDFCLNNENEEYFHTHPNEYEDDYFKMIGFKIKLNDTISSLIKENVEYSEDSYSRGIK